MAPAGEAAASAWVFDPGARYNAHTGSNAYRSGANSPSHRRSSSNGTRSSEIVKELLRDESANARPSPTRFRRRARSIAPGQASRSVSGERPGSRAGPYRDR